MSWCATPFWPISIRPAPRTQPSGARRRCRLLHTREAIWHSWHISPKVRAMRAAVLDYGPAAARRRRPPAPIGPPPPSIAAPWPSPMIARPPNAPLFSRPMPGNAPSSTIRPRRSGASHAIALWRQAGDRLKEGGDLSSLAWPLVRSGQNAAAEAASRRAIDVLEALPPTSRAGRGLSHAGASAHARSRPAAGRALGQEGHRARHTLRRRRHRRRRRDRGRRRHAGERR